MERDVAVRIDGFLWAVRDNLASVAAYMKRNLSEVEFKKYINLIGTSMAKTVEISNALHNAFPDIVSAEFQDGSPAPADLPQPASTRRNKAGGNARRRRRDGA
jgi:hypothetical protein